MKLVLTALLVTALNVVSTQLWAGYCSTSITDAKHKPALVQILSASEEDKKKKKKKKKEGESGDDEPECD